MNQLSETDYSVYEKLQELYKPLSEQFMCLFGYLMESGMKFEEEYSDGNYYQKADGSYDEADFPLPKFTITDVCEIFLNFESVDFYTYLSTPLPHDVLEHFRVEGPIEFEQANDLLLFQMTEVESGKSILEFIEELKKAGAEI